MCIYKFAEPNGVLDLGHFASQILRYFDTQLRILRFSDPTVLRIFDPPGGPDPPHPDLPNECRPLSDPILGPSLAILGSTWPFQAHLEANMASKWLSSRLQAHSKTSKQPLCKVFDISVFARLAPQGQAFQAQDLPQGALLDPPRRAKEGPR